MLSATPRLLGRGNRLHALHMSKLGRAVHRWRVQSSDTSVQLSRRMPNCTRQARRDQHDVEVSSRWGTEPFRSLWCSLSDRILQNEKLFAPRDLGTFAIASFIRLKTALCAAIVNW